MVTGCRNDTSPTISIIPTPVEIEIGQGAFQVNEATKLLFDGASMAMVEVTQEYFQSITSLDLERTNEQRDNVIVFKVMNLPSNEYRISASSSQIMVSGGSEQALLNGLQTLRQVLLTSVDLSIPVMELVDRPAFPWRGLLLDCSRHFMEKDFVKRYIDLLALYKMNVLHWHLTEDQGWRIAIDKYPLLTEIGAWRGDGNGGKYGGFYTKADIREVVAYASARGIMVVPEIELPGHSQAALAAYPQLSCTGGPFEVETEWGVFKEIYCAGNDSTFMFLEDVLTEVIELFPSEYIHIGGDEVPKYRWEHCEKCQRRIMEEGLEDEHELQTYFIDRIGAFLHARGKKMIGWDEIAEGGLPEGATVQSWRGFEGAINAVKMGHQAIVSPTSHAYFDYGLNDIDLEKVHGFNPIPAGISIEQAALILGGECNLWSERAPQVKVDSKVFPRLIAMAEVLWTGEGKGDFDEFRDRLANHYPLLDGLGVNYGFETVPVKIGTTTVEKELLASLESYDASINIYYDDGVQNVEYQGPQRIIAPTTWAITFGRGSSVFKDTIFQRFEPHLGNGVEPEITSTYHHNYTAGGQGALTNGTKGSSQFRDGNWQGYWGDDVEVFLDFRQEVTVRELSSGFLQYNNAWIFFPTEVVYEVSQDGEDYKVVGTVTNQDTPRNKEQKTQEYTVSLPSPLTARYVRMKAKSLGICPDWHDAAGSKAWLFIDEFSVK